VAVVVSNQVSKDTCCCRCCSKLLEHHMTALLHVQGHKHLLVVPLLHRWWQPTLREERCLLGPMSSQLVATSWHMLQQLASVSDVRYTSAHTAWM
jgi:hypothetical protein